MTVLRDSPVFIAGHPKSGTSLLRSVLESHPELIAYPEETSFFRRYLPKATGKSLEEKLALSDQFLTHIFEWNQSNPPAHQAGFPDRDYSNIPVAEVRQAVRQFVDECFRHDGDMLSAAILAFGKATGKITSAAHYWVEKTPYNEFYAAQIFAWWPQARIIHIVRDPRDNFASYHRKHTNWSPEIFALNWARSTQAGLDNRERYGDNHVWLLRYEDLVSSPEEKQRELCQFLNIADLPSQRSLARGGKPWQGNSMFGDQFNAISSAPVGRWVETLTEEEAATVEVITGPLMQRLGYAVSKPINSLDKQSRQRVIRRLFSLSLASKSPQERKVIASAADLLSHSPQIKTAENTSIATIPARWQLFVKLSILWFKEIFSK